MSVQSQYNNRKWIVCTNCKGYGGFPPTKFSNGGLCGVCNGHGGKYADELSIPEKCTYKCINRYCYETAIRRGQRCPEHMEREGCAHMMKDGRYSGESKDEFGFWLDFTQIPPDMMVLP